MSRRTRRMDPESRALVDVIRAAAAPGVQPAAVLEGLRAALEADAVLALGQTLRTRKGGKR